MLSAETAAGEFPLDAVTIMDRIIDSVEADTQYKSIRDASRPVPTGTTRDAISAAARQVAHTLSVGAVVTFTSSGSTTLRAARQRPDVPILCLTTEVTVARQMALVWGTHAVVGPDVRSFGEMVAVAVHVAREQGFAQWKDQIVITAGVPFGTPGTTNIYASPWLKVVGLSSDGHPNQLVAQIARPAGARRRMGIDHRHCPNILFAGIAPIRQCSQKARRSCQAAAADISCKFRVRLMFRTASCAPWIGRPSITAARFRQAGRRDIRGIAADLRHQGAGGHLSLLGNWRLGSGHRQCAATGRSRADVRDRPVRHLWHKMAIAASA